MTVDDAIPEYCVCGHGTNDHVWRGTAPDECTIEGCDCLGFEWETAPLTDPSHRHGHDPDDLMAWTLREHAIARAAAEFEQELAALEAEGGDEK